MAEQDATELSSLMALLAHDLRNPLSALLTNLSYVRSSLGPVGTEIDEALGDATISCAMLTHLIGNLDVLARRMANGPAFVRAAVLRQVVSEAVSRAQPVAQLSRIRLELSDAGVGSVLIEPELFGRSLDNLLANALQYSPAGGSVSVELSSLGAAARVRILDAGPTVPVELREAVLTAQGQAMAKQRIEARYGRGLALYCAATAARLAGAVVRVGEWMGKNAFDLEAKVAV